jgi:hypothetical protein
MSVSHAISTAPRLPLTMLRNIRSVESQIELAAGKLRRLDGDNRWKVIVCQRGRVWVTQTCDPADYVLAAGEMFVITQPGRVLVEALVNALIQVSPAVETPPFAGDYAQTIFA